MGVRRVNLNAGVCVSVCVRACMYVCVCSVGGVNQTALGVVSQLLQQANSSENMLRPANHAEPIFFWFL